MTTDLRIRRADLGSTRDLAAIADLVAAFGTEEGGDALPWHARESLGHHLRRRASFVLLAESAGTPVAVLLAQRNLSSFTALDSCNIHDVYVAEPARGRGIARRLMHAAEDHARALGCGRMTLEVNTDNHPALVEIGCTLEHDATRGRIEEGERSTKFVFKHAPNAALCGPLRPLRLCGHPTRTHTKTNTTYAANSTRWSTPFMMFDSPRTRFTVSSSRVRTSRTVSAGSSPRLSC